MKAIASLERELDRNFGLALRHARAERGLTQAELAEVAGVSARHLSFLETSRARPSRLMVSVLVDACHASREDRERLFHAAGFVMPEHGPGATLSRLDAELQALVAPQGPFPAWVTDAHWNLRHHNRTAKRVFHRWLEAAGAPVNLLCALCADQGFVLNRAALAATLASRLGAPFELPSSTDVLHRAQELGSALMPFYPLVVAGEGLALNMVACVSPCNGNDPFASSLLLHTLFPVDEGTLHHFRKDPDAPSLLLKVSA
jgi:transcriptional regulator with XRE-family HTH domain